MRGLALIGALLLAALPLRAEEVVMGLSRNTVAITADFDGSEVLIFGAVKREVPILPEPPLQVIVTVEGPLEPVTVWRKARRMGIWVNSEAVEVDSAPGFYAVATSAPWSDVISAVEDLRHEVSIPRAIRSVGAPMEIMDSQSFTEALIRIREAEGLYRVEENSVELRDSTLFDAAITMPANISEGRYVTRVLLTRGGVVVSEHSSELMVSKVGLERWLFNLSRNMPLAYGLLSLAIAAFAGWGASAAFRAMRSG
ncbi:TIGR02186 family protein [Salipiger marinus]|uniref:TIGR02186 family protein n=1 Tax=Salipiger marinus TaxID=555512 RepID=UPI0040593695